MGQLIEDLLSLSRVTRTPMASRTTNLSDLMAEVAGDLRQREPQRRVEVVIAPGVVASGDAHLLRIALENIVGNAWKYTSTRPTARIEFGVRERDGTREYFVRDDGVGFDMADADRLFVPFSRLPSASGFEGSGVGLATAQRVIHRHGGRIWAESAPERGATFFFTLG